MTALLSAPTAHEGDRVLVRDRAWRVQSIEHAAEGHALLHLLPTEGDGHGPLAVVSPPERVLVLPPETLSFDRGSLTPFAPWARAHQALAVTAVQERALSGALGGRVNLEAYQVAPVLRLLAKPRPRLLIADDVGLGKTIEAGLCLLELMQRGVADRVLVVVPPGLIPQWEDELLQRFELKFRVVENASGLAREQSELPAGVTVWSLSGAKVITSLDYLKRDEVRRRALARPWDMIIVDEAHALAEAGTPQNPYRTRRTRLGVELRDNARGLLLLTATPHNGYSHSFRSLIEIVEPTSATLVGTHIRDRIDRAMVRRMKRQIVRRDPSGSWVPAFLAREVNSVAVGVSAAEGALFQLVSKYCSRTAREAEGSEERELISFAMQIVKKRAASSRLALARTLENRLAALKREDDREEKPDRAELRDLQANLPMPDLQAERMAMRIVKSAIPRQERRRRDEIRKITEIQRTLRKVGTGDPKVAALLDYLRRVHREDKDAKVIVFTEYLDTLESIRSGLEADVPEYRRSFVELSGGLSLRERVRRQAAFEEPAARILLATDAASEGLNLQRKCHHLVHFELPWNPNRLEQRNGRIDRYGQMHTPKLSYLYYPDSPEDDVLARLVLKLEEMAEQRISTPDLLGVIGGLDLEQRLTELEPGDPAASKRLVRDFEDRTAEFIGEVRPLVLGHSDVEGEIKQTEDVLLRAEPLLRDDLGLESLLSGVLGDDSFIQLDEGIYEVRVPSRLRGPGVLEKYPKATCRRSLAARSAADEIAFLTPLHPLVRAIAAAARRELVQVYSDERGLRAKRLAARRTHRGADLGVLFTFLGRISGSDRLLEESVLGVRVAIDGTVSKTPAADLSLMTETTSPGEVPGPLLHVFEDRFEDLRRAAHLEALRRLRSRADEIRRERHAVANQLREDAKAYRADRYNEILEEDERTKWVAERGGQQLLWSGDQPKRYSAAAKRAAADAYLDERLKEIDGFGEVADPQDVVAIGALLLIPPDR